MKRRRIILLSVAALCICCLIVAVSLFSRAKPELAAGPTFNGRTVTAWIDSIQIANPDDAGITNLIGIGRPALPFLIRAVEWKPSPLDRLGGVLWRRAGWLARRLDLPHPENTRHRETSKRGVMYVLARLGPVAKDALPPLRQVARDFDWGNRAFALSAIADIGPEPKDIPRLIQALADKQRSVRFQAARCLGNLGFPSKEAISALTNARHDQDEAVRKQVSAALTKLDPDGAAKAGMK